MDRLSVCCAQSGQGSITDLEDAQEQAQAHQCRPIFNETKTDHHYAPGECDGGKPDAWPKEARKDRSRWLEDHVGDEENECDDRLEIKSAVRGFATEREIKGR